MVELIFVVVVIGILAVVAIPGISSNRDNAKGAICAAEFESIITEIIANYTILGYTGFQTITISSISNILANQGAGGTGISESGTALLKDGLSYNCEGDKAVDITFFQAAGSSDYNMTITLNTSASVPEAIAARDIIRQHYHMSESETFVSIPLSY